MDRKGVSDVRCVNHELPKEAYQSFGNLSRCVAVPAHKHSLFSVFSLTATLLVVSNPKV